MSRANWKGLYITNKKISDTKNFKKNFVFIVSRNNKILPKFLGTTVKIFNGKKYHSFIIGKKMLLKHKFGEFFSTRATFFFKNMNKKLKK